MRKSLTVLALTGAAVMIGGSAMAAPPLHAQMNHEAYWEGVTGLDCYKIEIDEDGVYEYELEMGGEVVIVKAGRDHQNIGSVDMGGVAYSPNGKAISHIIVCGEGEYGGGGGGGTDS